MYPHAKSRVYVGFVVIKLQIMLPATLKQNLNSARIDSHDCPELSSSLARCSTSTTRHNHPVVRVLVYVSGTMLSTSSDDQILST